MAEALFADRNPEERYVTKQNATQNDFTRPRVGGGPPLNTQVKFHADPSRYLADMRNDWQAHRFAVPDDHVAPLKALLNARYAAAVTSGNTVERDVIARDLGRVRPIGATSSEITGSVASSGRTVAREAHAAYTSFGAAAALSLAPIMWDWSMGKVHGNQAMYQATRSLNLIGVTVGTDTMLRFAGQGALRGTLRGNAIVGTVVSATEITWLLYEHGWRQAFQQASFYEAVGGTLGAGTLALAGSAAGFGVGGPWGAVIGGLVGGTAGYFGGRLTTFTVLDILKPEMLQTVENQQLQDARVRLNDAIKALTTL